MLLNELLRAIAESGDLAVTAALNADLALVNSLVPSEGDRQTTPLHRAIPSDGVELTDERMRVIRVLAERAAHVDAVGWGANNGSCTALTMAAWGGHAPVVGLLLALGANPNGAPDQAARRRRPIDTASEHDHPAVVEALIEGGAEFSLRHLVRVGLVERAERFLAENPDAALESEEPLLHLAADAATARVLIAAGADLAACDRAGRTALLSAIENGRDDVTALLIGAGAIVDLFAAASLGDGDRVAALLTKSPGLSRVAQADGATALFYAVNAGDERSCALLLADGAAASPVSRRFWACLTPLHLALQRGHGSLARRLLEHGAGPDDFSVEGGYWPTPLHAAVRWGGAAEIDLLLDYGADPNAGDSGVDRPGSLGTSVLGCALFFGNEAALRQMLARGLDVRQPAHRGALHLAAEYGHVGVARALLEAGASIDGRDAGGETARERALRYGRREVVALLDDWGG